MLSSNVKYIGLDVHKEAVAIAVLNGAAKSAMESIVETKASTLLDFPARVERTVARDLRRRDLGLGAAASTTCSSLMSRTILPWQ